MDVHNPITTRANSMSALPEYIINTFFPGARPLISRYPSLFRLLALISALYYFFPADRVKDLWNQFSSFLISTISVTSDEELFEYLVEHISTVRNFRADQSLIASSSSQDAARARQAAFDEDDLNALRRSALLDPLSAPKIKYEQSQGVQLFIYKSRLFIVSRINTSGHTYVNGNSRSMERLSVSCLGRNTKPIKELLESIYAKRKASEQSLTIIRRPYPQNAFSDRLFWSRVTAKPRRRLETVILEQDKKERILADVSEYLSPETRDFYGSHGIPYRRGYLFHGPPGTGKSSFALALAAHFDLDVFALTLIDQAITDSELLSLLNMLPPKALLLLEDIDTAGLQKRPTSASSGRERRRRRFLGLRSEPDESEKADEETEGEEDQDAEDDPDSDDEDEKDKTPIVSKFGPPLPAAPVAQEIDQQDREEDDVASRPPNIFALPRRRQNKQRSRVSLSALLNAIDGVAAPEGHVLIMTTNNPEMLDEALVRAGRVSVRVGFTRASRAVAEKLFLKMFDPHFVVPGSQPHQQQHHRGGAGVELHVSKKRDENVKALAEKFAAQVDEGEFSPSDLQDYFLMRKNQPRRAVEEVEILRREMQERKSMDFVEVEEKRKRMKKKNRKHKKTAASAEEKGQE